MTPDQEGLCASSGVDKPLWLLLLLLQLQSVELLNPIWIAGEASQKCRGQLPVVTEPFKSKRHPANTTAHVFFTLISDATASSSLASLIRYVAPRAQCIRAP
jgi:hypothetical protein